MTTDVLEQAEPEAPATETVESVMEGRRDARFAAELRIWQRAIDFAHGNPIDARAIAEDLDLCGHDENQWNELVELARQRVPLEGLVGEIEKRQATLDAAKEQYREDLKEYEALKKRLPRLFRDARAKLNAANSEYAAADRAQRELIDLIPPCLREKLNTARAKLAEAGREHTEALNHRNACARALQRTGEQLAQRNLTTDRLDELKATRESQRRELDLAERELAKREAIVKHCEQHVADVRAAIAEASQPGTRGKGAAKVRRGFGRLLPSTR